MKLLYIDLFCGAGGTSTGVENARHDGRQCAKVIGCVNHDANAIASHAANHPDALHFTEDIRTLELSPLTAHIAEMRRQFFDKVALMRKLQKEYFRTRSKTALNQSKAVEREVDAEIARVHDALGTPATKQPEQRNIFEEDASW